MSLPPLPPIKDMPLVSWLTQLRGSFVSLLNRVTALETGDSGLEAIDGRITAIEGQKGVVQTRLDTLADMSSGFSSGGNAWDIIHTFDTVEKVVASSLFVVRFSFDFTQSVPGAGPLGELQVGVFVDSETTARNYAPLDRTAPSVGSTNKNHIGGLLHLSLDNDGQPHNIHLKIRHGDNLRYSNIVGGMSIELAEVAQ